MSVSIRVPVLCVLLLAILTAGSGLVSAGDDGLLGSTTETLNDTTDTVSGTVNDTTDTVTGTVNDTTDTVTGTVNDTTETLENTTSDLTDSVDDGTGVVSDSGGADDGITVVDDPDAAPTYRFVLALATNGDLLDSPTERFVGALAVDSDLDSDPILISSMLLSEVDQDALAPGSTTDEGDGGSADVAAPSGEGLNGGVAGRSGAPLPGVPPEGLLGGGLLGVAAVGVLVRQGLLSVGSASTLAGAAVAPVKTAGSSALDRLTRLVAPLRYSRFDDSDPLEHDVRGRLYEVVERAPGAYLSEVSERAGVPLSTARHHARVLEREGLIASGMVRGRRRFYPGAAEELALAAALNDEPTAGLVDALVRVGPASVSALAEELDRDPSTITHHLSRLEEDGIVVRERDGRAIQNRLSPEAQAALDPDVEAEPRAGPVVSAD